MTTTPPQRRRWFQFRLRTLLIAVFVLSLPLSWFAVKVEKARRQREAVEAIARLGGRVNYDWEDPTSSAQHPNRFPSWLRDLLGDDFFCNVVAICCENRISDADLEDIGSLRDLEWLNLGNAQVTDLGLEHLEGLDTLERLFLDSTQITDAGLEHIRGLKKLSHLGLWDAQVTDTGLQYLRGLTGLQELDLTGTNVTPEGVKKLQEALDLRSAKITSSGVEELREALPDCQIEYQTPNTP